MRPTARAARIARIRTKNIGLGLPAHGMPFQHRTVAEVESARPAPAKTEAA